MAVAAASRRRGLAALCATEIVSYGTLYYAFPVLAADITADTGWSRTAITGAFSAGNLLGGIAGVGVGRVLERSGPRLVMTGGSVLATGALLTIAGAPTFGWFVAGWLLAGIATAAVFYPPAFAAITGWYGPERVAALTTLTLVAGFSSTVFAPLTAALADRLSWRGVYVVLAAVLAVVTIPAHALALRQPWPRVRVRVDRTAVDGDARSVLTSRPFLLLVTAMTLSAFTFFAVVVNLVPLLTGRGLSPVLAAWALGLGGVGQVVGRLGYRRLAAHVGARGRTVAVLLAGAAATLLLGVIPAPAALLVAVAVLAGAVRGLFTLLEATLVSDHWGTARYAALNGVFTAPLTAAIAVAPTAGAALAGGLGGYPQLFAVLAGIGLVSAGLAALARPDRGRRVSHTSRRRVWSRASR